MQTQKITLSGGFHNSSDINLRLKNNELSEGQYKRLNKHMCGVQKCICGWRGYELDGIDRAIFGEMLENVSYKIWSK
tara:strand:+ start:1921 stop:2151 length:231 start_codon:yes stop_codon:yes gene_type:complete